MVGAQRNFKRLLDDVIAVRVLDQICQLVGVADFNDILGSSLRVTSFKADLNYI